MEIPDDAVAISVGDDGIHVIPSAEDTRTRTEKVIEWLDQRIAENQKRISQMEAAKLLLSTNEKAAEYFEVIDAAMRG